MEIKRILIGVDYSAHARRAVEYGVDLARSFDAQLLLVHVWERPSYLPEGLVVGPPGGERRTLVELIQENAEREMADFLCGCECCEGLELRTVLETGVPATAIVRVIQREQCDLVVMGARGDAHALQHLILGSVTARVIRLSPVPVVTVPNPRRSWRRTTSAPPHDAGRAESGGFHPSEHGRQSGPERGMHRS